MWGGEERTGYVKLPKGSTVYHFSTTKILSFTQYNFPESTCFTIYDVKANENEYKYAITTGFDRKVGQFGHEEVRFDLRKEDEILEVKSNRIVAIIEV